MKTHDFDKLTEKFNAGLCTPDELEFLKRWADSALLVSERGSSSGSKEEEIAREARIWGRLENSGEIEQQPASFLPRQTLYLRTIFTAAAACAVLIIGYTIVSHKVPQRTAENYRGIETRNSTQTIQKVFLSDGSTVILHQNANIVVDENFGKKTRTVHLTGEAFFDIARNEKIPFMVYSGDLVTEVLGTSFHIKPQADGRAIEVSVNKGKVSVYANHSQKEGEFDGVILTPNQRVIYDVVHQTIRQGIVETPRILQSEKALPAFDFREVSISQVLDVLQSAYGVDFVLPASELRKCLFTGDLGGLTMHQQLKFICDSVGARFEIRGTTVFIFGDTCG